jgi:alpha-methylacyl-CoA racemase
MTAALEGVRVLDLTRNMPGPFCTMLLGDLGADVVKVEEPPIGDPTRVVPPAVGEDSAVHAALNRNKRSVVVDLRSEGGSAVLRRLAERADVLVEGFRPGVLARRGLGAEALLAANPRLVYCSITGYGRQAPLAGRAGHDVNYLALSGLLGTTVDAEGRPVLPVTQIADMTSGLTATLGILAALQARERTGRGQVVDASLFDSALALMTVPLTRRLAGGPMVNELAGTQGFYNVYRCRDGRYLSVGALEPKFWQGLCQALGVPELVSRQYGSGERARQVVEKLAGIFAGKDRDTWVRELATADVCVEPVLDADEVLAQAQTARSLIEGRTAGTPFRTVGFPVRLSETPAGTRRDPPRLGQHTDEVLAEIGYGSQEIESLRGTGALA